MAFGSLNLIGDINLTNGEYRINGVPISVGTAAIVLAHPPPAPASPAEGQLWFDTATHHLLIYVTGAWFQLT